MSARNYKIDGELLVHKTYVLLAEWYLSKFVALMNEGNNDDALFFLKEHNHWVSKANEQSGSVNVLLLEKAIDSFDGDM